MQHTRTIQLSSAIACTPEAILKGILNQVETLRLLLNEYPYFGERTGVVKDVRIEASSLEIEPTRSGSFDVFYNIQFYFACEYEYKEHPQKMKVGFELDKEGTTLTLIGAYWPERDGEEF
jgi:hypothetical protein